MMHTDNYPVVRPIGSLRVADLARKAEVTPATIRYYARIGMLNPNREPENDYRCFSRADLRRVVFIRKAQALGLTISDIKRILGRVDEGEVPCDQVKLLVKRRRAGILDKIVQLQATEVRISEALNVWSLMGDPVCGEDELCPLVERIGAPVRQATDVSIDQELVA